MKSNESLCEFIGAVAVALFMAVLVALWFFQVVLRFNELEAQRHRAVESRMDSANS